MGGSVSVAVAEGPLGLYCQWGIDESFLNSTTSVRLKLLLNTLSFAKMNNLFNEINKTILMCLKIHF